MRFPKYLLFLFLPSIVAASGLNSRTLVVYATNDPDSVSVQQHYVSARNIPAANLCPITLPDITAITLTVADYTTYVKTPVRNCLNNPNVGKQNILYIVVAYVRPYRVQTPSSSPYALDSFLADIWDQYTTQYLVNPGNPHRYYADNQNEGNYYVPFMDLATYRTQPKASLIYSVWRLDGATPAIAMGLVDKAMAAEAMSGGPVGNGYFDLQFGDVTNHPDLPDGFDGDWDLHRAAGFVGQVTHSPFSTLEEFGECGLSGAPTCPNALFYSGWHSSGYQDVFTWNPGAIGYHLHSLSALDPRGAGSPPFSTCWVANALKGGSAGPSNGITVTTGSMTEPFLEGFPRPAGVFLNILQGANVGDAFLRNTRWLKWVILNFGDPLYRPFPGGIAPFNQPLLLNSMFLNPQIVVGGASVNGTITLAAPAPPGGTTFTFTSTIPAVLSPPAPVTVQQGNTTANFVATTSTVTAFIDPVLKANSGSINLANAVGALPLLSDIAVNPSTVTGGQNVTGTVFLNASAPAGGVTITLTSHDPHAIMPSCGTSSSCVFISTGLPRINFTITTTPVLSNTPIVIDASYAGATVSTTLTLTP